MRLIFANTRNKQGRKIELLSLSVMQYVRFSVRMRSCSVCVCVFMCVWWLCIPTSVHLRVCPCFCMVYVCAYFNVYVCVFENVRIASCGEREKYHRIVHVLYSYFDCKRSPAAQWIKGWPTDPAVPSSSPA